MAEKLTIALPIVVEGKYDKIRLSSLLDATILTLNGFSIFRQEEKKALLRRMAGKSGIILLTDPDGGGKLLRSHLRTMLPKEGVIQLHIPAIKGKERRKAHPSRAGLLGVEGMDDATLLALFAPFAVDAPPKPTLPALTKADLYRDGLSGRENSEARRRALLLALSLPPDLSANALLEAINLLSLQNEYYAYLRAASQSEPAPERSFFDASS